MGPSDSPHVLGHSYPNAKLSAVGDEKRNSLATIAVHALSAGRNHVAATLSNSSMDQSAAYGRDVYIWVSPF